VVSVSGAEAALATAAPVLVFLFALFLFAGALDEAGALDHLARWLIGRARRPTDLPMVVFVGFGFVSAFLVNDALVVIGVPILLAVARRLAIGTKPLLLALAFSVSVGSVFTPFGNPQNLLVSLDSGIPAPAATFLRYLFLPTLVNLAVGGLYLAWVFRSESRGDPSTFESLRAAAPPLFPPLGWAARLRRAPVLWVFPGTLIVLLTFDVAAALTGGPSVPSWQTAAAGAVVLLLVSSHRGGLVRRVNWEVLLLFAGLFVVVAGAVHGGVVATLERYVALPGPGRPTAGLATIAVSSLVGSQFVSNVPWVALEAPILSSAGYSGASPLAWMALAGFSTLAGNVTLLGAASNLIVVDLAERRGVKIRLGEFVRYGLPLAALTAGVLFVCLWLGL
jgi:Na+/H+ antiporter NhaD/arsenite permease-like protein